MISVAMATYNGEKYINDMLDSIIGQDLKVDEIVICDDNSTDGTVNTINEYINEKKIESIRLIENGENIGWRRNFRKALNECRGDYIFLCDQDDIWMPNKVKTMMGVMTERQDIELLVSNFEIYVEGNARTSKRALGYNGNDGRLQHLKFDKWFFYVIRPGCTFCIKKCLLEKVNKLDDDVVDHDSVLWAIPLMQNRAWLLRKRLIKFRRHPESATTDNSSFTMDNRIKYVDNTILTTKWALDYCKKYVSNRVTQVEVFLDYLIDRKNNLEQGNIFNMMSFVVKNMKYYPSLRNAVSDIILVYKKNT